MLVEAWVDVVVVVVVGAVVAAAAAAGGAAVAAVGIVSARAGRGRGVGQGSVIVQCNACTFHSLFV